MPTFSTVTELLPHQVDAVAKLLPPRVGALFAEMGTGKSRILLELARLRQSKFDRLFWFCPVSLKATVRREIALHTDIPDAAVHVFDDRTDDANVPRDCLVYVIGIESMSSSNRVVLAYRSLVTKDSFVAVDESTYIKGNKATRTKRITHMSGHVRYRAVLTGTPITQGVVDLYSQMLFLSPRVLGYRSWYSFAANHLEYREKKIGKRKVRTQEIVRTHNHEYLASKIAPYAYQITKAECTTLPEKLREWRYFDMTQQQLDAYAEAKDIFLQTDVDEWSSLAIFRLYTALQGIVCGYVVRGGQHVSLAHRRVDVLMEVLDGLPQGEPVIVWTTLHHAVDEIVVALKGRPVSRFTGRLSERDREAELARWRREGGYLVATQAAGGHGLTLNEAAYAVFYNDGFKYSSRVQAEDRNHRIGQGRQPTYVTLSCSNSIDARIAQRLGWKQHGLAAFRAEVEQCRKQGLKNRAIELVRAL